jgi:bifunctional oligoribonuclease and PAP phosphatase NrnA
VTGWRSDLDADAMPAALERLREAARDGETVVLACHVSPDGDALGAMLALHLALQHLGARSIPTWGEEPQRVPGAYVDLPGVEDLVVPSQLPEHIDLLVTLDAASEERLGTVAELLHGGVPSIVIDHHPTNTGFGDIRLVSPSAAATVSVVDELVRQLGVRIGPRIATNLYVGLVTDTGRFQHANTDRAAMELGGRLLEAGAPHEELGRRLFETRTLGELRLLGHALARVELVDDVALAHTHVTAAELDDHGVSDDQLEGLVDLVRGIDVVEVAMVAREAWDGWRVSLRSKGDVDVAAVAEVLGGGGHRQAAGFTVDGPHERIVADVLAGLREG